MCSFTQRAIVSTLSVLPAMDSRGSNPLSRASTGMGTHLNDFYSDSKFISSHLSDFSMDLIDSKNRRYWLKTKRSRKG